MRGRSRVAAGVACVVVGLVSGCAALGGSQGGSTAPPENANAPVDALVNPAHPGLEACKAGVAAATLEDDLEIAADFKESCHELVVCGGLSMTLTTTLISVFIDAAAGNSHGGPSGFTFDGKGTWTTGTTSAGTKMDVQLLLGADTTFGKAGDVITFDVFSLDTYLTGAKVVATASIDTSGHAATSLGISFTGRGKGYELLGLDPAAASPITIDAGKIADALGRMQLKTNIHVDDKQSRSTFVYDLDSPPTTLGALSKGAPLPMQLVGVKGGRADLGQTLAITTWDIRYLDTSANGYLDGTIGFAVQGGPLPYASTFTYPRRKAPDVSLACAAK